VWPPAVWLALALVLQFGVWTVAALSLGDGQIIWSRVVEDFSGIAPLVFLPAACAYGVYRIWAFHPVLRPGYRAWLTSTPWTAARPLPLGPVHLVPQDVLLLAITFALAWPAHGMTSLEPIKAFCFVYVMTLALALACTRESTAAFLTAFGGGGIVSVWSNQLSFFAVAALTYLIAIVGLERSYRRFPWDLDLTTVRQLLMARDGSARTFQKRLLNRLGGRVNVGWPFDYVSPKDSGLTVSCWQASMTSLLAGWWFFVLGSKLPADEPHSYSGRYMLLQMPLCYAMLYVVMARLAIYRVPERMPPISLWVRIRTGRLVIPGYDRVLIAPLLTVAVVLGGPVTLLDWGFSDVAATATGFGLALMTILAIGPSRKAWALTGDYRIVPGVFGYRPPNLV
jgi:hypothetical protein